MATLKRRKASKGFWLYWYNPLFCKAGVVEYTTTSQEKAIKLFYRDFDKDYQIMRIHD